jgi:hypothetical protein
VSISRKPTRGNGTEATPAQLLAFVEKGGSVPRKADDASGIDKAPQHPLKFPNRDLFERLERARAAGPVKLPRNTWILQAIAEKLAREDL